MGAVWMLGVAPCLTACSVRGPYSRQADLWYAVQGAPLPPHFLHVCAIATLVWLAVLGAAWYWLAAAVVSTGICSGVSGIIVAHELGHTRPKSISRDGQDEHALVLYGHFTEEHNVTHHKHVATTADPASADEGETVWGFVARTVPKQFRDAYTIHAKRGARGWRNRVVRVAAFEVVLVAALAALAPAAALVFVGKRRWPSFCSSTSTTFSTTACVGGKGSGRARCTAGNPSGGGRVGPCSTSAFTRRTT